MSQLALPAFLREGRRFDLAFVDGNHRFDAVFLDLFYLGRLLPKGAIVLLDDYNLPGIRRAVSSRVLGDDGQSLQTTISIGVAAFPDHDPGQLSGLVRNADEALYRAKRAGRNCVVPFAA